MSIRGTLGYYHELLMPERLYPRALKKWYKKAAGKELNLDDPKTFNEKLQWIKLYYRDPMMTRLSDKYLVREWIKNEIGEEYLIPLIGVYERFDDIDFDKLPESFVMKANHGSGWNIIVKDKASLDKKLARKKFNKWLKKNFAFSFGYQLHYSGIKPRIVIEEFISEKDHYLYDYKILVLGGKARYIWIDSDRDTAHHRNIFDFQWNPAPFTLQYPKKDIEPERPVNLEKMKELSEKLARGFNEVRVDFYEIEGKIYFGEMTFTSGSGHEFFDPPEWDRKLGDMFKLPEPYGV
ncbi:MAG: glycosyl transferase [Lachnospiraceae bacterium]|nr:glycosyl transferase [Lachnospiraceae bacterium]